MSLPGLALPGLNLADQPTEDEPSGAATLKFHNLPKETEYRFETSFARPVTVRVVTGNAEFFGTELAPNAAYTFQGAKGAIFTWLGCTLEVTGEMEAEYVAEETPMVAYANTHFALENLRNSAAAAGTMGPRVLVVGPSDVGKTSLVKMLSSYAGRTGRQSCVVNLDPEQGLLAPPGCFTATSFGSILDIEEGWGGSPISGPSKLPVKMPLCYHYGARDPSTQSELFKTLVTRMAVAVTSRLNDDEEAKRTGCLIDSPRCLTQAKSSVYNLIAHIVAEFSVNVVIVLGSEKLYSDLRRRLVNPNHDEPIAVVKLDKSGGCVSRDETYMKHYRQQQIKEYFFGRGNVTLSPYSQWLDFNQITIYRIDTASSSSSVFNAGDEDEDEDVPSGLHKVTALGARESYTKETPSLALQNSLIAITHANPDEPEAGIRVSSTMGYLYVSDVDEGKGKMKVLSPVGGRVPYKAMVRGSWPEDVVDLIG